MQKRNKGCRLVAPLLSFLVLAACQPAPLQAQSESIAEPLAESTLAPTTSPVPPRTALPATSPTREPQPDTEHVITVMATQDRPNEMPELSPREGNFAGVNPWTIDDAFIPAG